MKSFSRFLYEAYLSEEEARQGSLFTRSGNPQNFKNPKKIPFTATDPTPIPQSKRLPGATPVDVSKAPQGQLNLPISGSKPTNTPGSAGTSSTPRPPGTTTTVSGSAITGKTPPSPLTQPQVTPVDVKDITNPRRAAAELKMRQAAAGFGPSGKPFIGQPGKSPETPVPKGGKFLKWGGRALGVLNVASDAADEYGRQRKLGRSTASSLGMGLTKAAGGTAGWEAGAAGGAALGGAIGSLAPGPGTLIGAGIGGLAGGVLGSEVGSRLAGKASEIVAGAAPKEKAAMAKANLRRQAGSSLKGIGGKTTFSQQKPGGPAFMSTGVGAQRKTVQLAKTGVVQRGGQSTAGHLAFKDGKAVYKAGPSPQSLAQTSTNPLERIGRTFFPGAYKQQDIQSQQKALQKAQQSDIARNKALGVKYGPGR